MSPAGSRWSPAPRAAWAARSRGCSAPKVRASRRSTATARVSAKVADAISLAGGHRVRAHRSTSPTPRRSAPRSKTSSARLGPGRHPRQQRRREPPRADRQRRLRGRVGSHARGEPHRIRAHGPCVPAAPARRRRRTDRQHRVDRRPRRDAVHLAVYRVEARRRRADALARHRARIARDHGELHLPGADQHGHDRADPRRREAEVRPPAGPAASLRRARRGRADGAQSRAARRRRS